MELNESLAKNDQTVDGISKKLEKINQEHGNAEPRVVLSQGEVSALEFIQNFSWDDRLYSRNKTLLELS